MPVLNLTTGDLAGLFLRLLPRGGVWPKMLDALQPQAIAAIMPTYQRLVARDNYLLTDAFPLTSVELLPEWEATLGLPDPCSGPDATIAQRQAHVVARLTQSNGPSITSLVAYAAALSPTQTITLQADDGEVLETDDGTPLASQIGGYAISIQEFAPARYGVARYGDRYLGEDWAHAWQITVANGSLQSALYGSARYGERYQTFGNSVLECEMARLAPAHTVLLFAYTDPNANAGNAPGTFILGRDVLAG